MEPQPQVGSDPTTGARAQADPVAALVAIMQQREALDIAERAMIERARQRGFTFQQIANALGVTRQAVHARLRRARAGPLAVVGVIATYDDLVRAALSLST